MGHRGRLILVFILAAGALAIPVVALAGALTVRADLITSAHPRSIRLQITANGQRAYDQPVRARLCGRMCMTTPVTPAHAPLRVLDLQSNGSLEVVLGLYSGGAHCCFIDEVFTRVGGTDRYREAAQQNFLDAGANLVEHSGRWEFDSADARLADAGLTDFADSAAPLQIWRFRDGRFVDVTRAFPARIAADAARWMTAFRTHIANGVGFIAAWAADEYLLGRGRVVRATLQSEVRRNRLHGALGLPHNSEQAFAADLIKLLRRLGYTR